MMTRRVRTRFVVEKFESDGDEDGDGGDDDGGVCWWLRRLTEMATGPTTMELMMVE